MRKDKSGRGWLIVASCFCMGFIVDGVSFSYGLLFIEFLREFKQSTTETAWISAIFYGWFMFGPVVSILTKRFGCRAVTVCGGALSSVGFFCSVFSTSVQFLCFSYGCVAGFGYVLLNIPRDVVLIQYFEKRRAFAFGISVCGSGIGTIVFGPLTKWLVDEYGWRGTMLIETGLMLNCVACGLVMKPFVTNTNTGTCEKMIANQLDVYPDTTSEYTEKDATGNGISLPRTEKIKFLINLSLLKQPTFIIYFFTGLFRGLSYFTPFTFLPDMAVHKGWSREKAAWLLTVMGIVNTVCRIPIGKMADMRWVNRTLMLSVTICTIGIVGAVMPHVEVYELLVFVCVVFGCFIATYAVIYQVVVADVFGEENVTDVFGWTKFVFGVGSLISGPLAGGLFDATGNYILTFATAGVGQVIAGVLTFVLFLMHRRQVAETVDNKC